MNFLIALMTIAAIAMVLTTVGLIILLIQEFNRQSSKPSPQLFKQQRTGINVRTAKPLGKVPARQSTQNQLFRLLRGDHQVASRLVDRERERNPQQSEQWLWEKVIRDLERDRRI